MDPWGSIKTKMSILSQHFHGKKKLRNLKPFLRPNSSVKYLVGSIQTLQISFKICPPPSPPPLAISGIFFVIYLSDTSGKTQTILSFAQRTQA